MWRFGMVIGMAAAMVVGAARGAGAQANVSGCWVGTVGAGQQLARAVMRLEQGAEWTGTMSVMGRNMNVDTLRDLRVRGDTVTFGYGIGERETSVTAARGGDDALSGELTRGGTSHPLWFARSDGRAVRARALLGYWSGALLSGGAKVLAAGLRFRPAPCGQVYVTFDSPDQGTSDLPITAITMAGDSLRFEMQYVGGVFRGTVSADGTKIAGLWTQAGNTLDLELAKSEGG